MSAVCHKAQQVIAVTSQQVQQCMLGESQGLGWACSSAELRQGILPCRAAAVTSYQAIQEGEGCGLRNLEFDAGCAVAMG